ncbi:MAG TPA: ABC transporter substrate-binding protein [Herpetosiphonaceae bacterium]
MARRFPPLLALLLILGLLAACGGQSAGGEVIKIGFFGPLSGDTATDGTNARNAAQLAINQANANQTIPGKTLELVVYDDKLNPSQAFTDATDLVTKDKVSAVIGGSYSATTLKAAPVFQQAGVPVVVAYAPHPDITKDKPVMFRVIYTSTVMGKAMVIYGMDKLGYKSFHVLSLDNPYGNSIAESVLREIPGRGATLASSQKFTAGETDFADRIAAIAAKPADALILIGNYTECAEIIKQLRAKGVALPIIGGDGLDSPALPELGGAAAEGVVLSTDFSRDDPRPIVKDFIRDFRAAYNNQTPDLVAASTYDAATVLIQAIKRANSSQPQAIRDAIAATTTFEGVTGSITFTPNREVEKTVLFVKVDKGSFIYIDKLDPSQLR